IYNNSFVDANNQTGTVGSATNGYSHGSTGGAELNELFYYAQSLTDFNPYYCLDTACSPFTFGHNLGFCTGGTCNLRPHTYGSGAFVSDTGNIIADPKFTNYVGGDFTLQSGSPAIGAGTNLTTAVGTGSGSTALTVADAGYFQDGSGIPGVQPD